MQGGVHIYEHAVASLRFCSLVDLLPIDVPYHVGRLNNCYHPPQYTAHGGLKATYMCSYLHTVVLYAVLCLFTLEVYAVAPDLGSPSKVSFTEPVMHCLKHALTSFCFRSPSFGLCKH